jgi:PhoPQ-activated pathogenicity-related protein
VISGGSKRGWTSWLAAGVDKRLIGTAPMVIDVLNFRAHMDQQLATWGKYSEQIADYSSKGLIKQGEESPRERRLREMMDPYSYLSVIQIPKLLIHGTNDPYWCVDATRFYWDDMIGPKYVLKLPNAGHGLETNRDLALRTLGVFFRQVVTRSALPEMAWKPLRGETSNRLVVTSTAKPSAARFWTARSDSKDFRVSKWTSKLMENGGADYVGTVEHPTSGHVAYFGELEFESDGLPFSLTTLVFWE